MFSVSVHVKIIPKVAADSISIYSVEVESDFTSKEIVYLAELWSQTTAELASVLAVESHSSNQQVLQDWLKGQKGDKRSLLVAVFEQEGYPNMADIVYDIPVLS